MGFIVLFVYDFVLHGFYHVDCIRLCIASVLMFCWYLIMYCMGFIVLLIFECILHGFQRVVGF